MEDADVIDQEDDGLVIVLDESPSPDHASSVRMAVEVCPSSALSIIE
jgi:ferredoxin